MRAEQLEAWVEPWVKKKLEEDRSRYEKSRISLEFVSSMMSLSQTTTAYKEACAACMESMHKLRVVFDYGYLALQRDAIGNEAAQIALYREIAEYLRLVCAGIDSFVATHPIRAVEEGEVTG
jgi:hypothetical protein